MSRSRRSVPQHILRHYVPGSRSAIERGHMPLPCGQRNGVHVDRGEAWTEESKRFAKQELARARRRASTKICRQAAYEGT